MIRIVIFAYNDNEIINPSSTFPTHSFITLSSNYIPANRLVSAAETYELAPNV